MLEDLGIKRVCKPFDLSTPEQWVVTAHALWMYIIRDAKHPTHRVNSDFLAYRHEFQV